GRLVVLAEVRLRGIAQEGVVLLVEAIIQPSVVARIAIRRGNGGRRLRAEVFHQIQLLKRVRVNSDVGQLAPLFERKKEEALILVERPAYRTAILLAAERRFVRLFLPSGGIAFRRFESLMALIDVTPAVEFVRAGFGDDVDRRAFAASIRR